MLSLIRILLARAFTLLAVLLTSSTLAFDSLWQPAQSNEEVGNSRAIQLQHAGTENGKLLATFEHWHSDGSPSNYIVRESTDNGTTWDTLTNVTAPEEDLPTPTKSYFQPFLFEFPRQLGKYAEGTIMLFGNLQGSNATSVYSWRSPDHGRTWDPIGIWQSGWSPGNVSVSHSIWEPFLFLNSLHRLVAVFSDERNMTTRSQKLVEVISTDGGDSWSKPKDIIVGSLQSSRPGMATVVKMDNGEYFMSYEWCDTRNYPKPCAVRGITSKDGATWNATDEGVFVSSPDNVQGIGSPYSLWDPVGKQLIVSSRRKMRFSETPFLDSPPILPEDQHTVHVNLDHGGGNWHWASAPWYVPLGNGSCKVNYSPNLLVLSNGTILYSAKTQAVPPGKQCEQSPGAAPIGVLPYNSDFAATGNVGWIDLDQIWSVSGDNYTFPPVTASSIVLTGSSGWTDYETSADAIVTSSSGVVGLLARAFRLEDAPNGITRYTAAIDSNRGDLTVYRVSDGGATVLSSEPVSGGIKTNQRYHLSLSVKAASIFATVTGTGGVNTSVSVTDDRLGRGMAGLFGSYGSGGFSNVQIRSIA